MIDIFSEELNWFWDLIAKSEQDEKKLTSALMKLDRSSLQLFIDAFEEAALELNGSPYLKYVRPDLSEDGVDDITHWVVSQGKKYYTRVVEHAIPGIMTWYRNFLKLNVRSDRKERLQPCHIHDLVVKKSFGGVRNCTNRAFALRSKPSKTLEKLFPLTSKQASTL